MVNMKGKGTEIYTDRLMLRPFTLNDLESTHLYAGDIDNSKYMIYLPNETKEQTEKFLHRVICEMRNGKGKAKVL